MNRTIFVSLTTVLILTLPSVAAQADKAFKASKKFSVRGANAASTLAPQSGKKWIEGQGTQAQRVIGKPDVIILDEPPVFWPVTTPRPRND